jgi:hypothetical protein
MIHRLPAIVTPIGAGIDVELAVDSIYGPLFTGS